MRRFFVFSLKVFFFLTFSFASFAQPFDYLVPDTALGESLSGELRQLHDIDRDIGLEKLSTSKKPLDAFIELGELRLAQGNLEEAERYFEMALKRQPNNLRANQGLSMVNYRYGRFGKTKELLDRLTELYPLSDSLKDTVEKVRAKLSTTCEVGLKIHEDNRGISENTSSLELYFPSFTYPKLSARYRLDAWNFKENADRVSSRTLSSTFEYILDHRTSFSLTYAPETVGSQREIAGYKIHGVTGTNDLHLAAFSGRGAFKENFATTQLQLAENYSTIVLFGELHDRSRISQSFTASEISDGNSRRRFDTDVLYFITRAGIPILSLDLKLYQSDYERQINRQGGSYTYWTPTDFRGAEFDVSWERGVGARWWWGVETHFIGNTFRDSLSTSQSERGIGFKVHLSYRFETGRLYSEFADTIRDFYRERTLGFWGSFDL